MKLMVFGLVILALVALGPDPAQSMSVEKMIQEYIKNHPMVSNVIRRKRDKSTGPNSTQGKINSLSGTSSDSDSSGAECLLQCVSPMAEMANSSGFNNEIPTCPKYDANQFDHICSIYNQVKTCMAGCPQSQMIQGITQVGFHPLEYMCVERKDDMKKYGPCLSTSCEDIKKQCEPTCGSMNSTMTELMNIQKDVQHQSPSSDESNMNISTIVGMVGKACHYVSCMTNCSQDPVTKKCGADAYQLEVDLVNEILNSTTRIMTVVGLDSAWPDECRPMKVSPVAQPTASGNQNETQAQPATKQNEQNTGKSGATSKFSLGWQLSLVSIVFLKMFQMN